MAENSPATSIILTSSQTGLGSDPDVSTVPSSLTTSTSGTSSTITKTRSDPTTISSSSTMNQNPQTSTPSTTSTTTTTTASTPVGPSTTSTTQGGVPPSSQITPGGSHGGNLSAGGVAGVSIASAVLGAALAVAILVVLMRRRHRRSTLGRRESRPRHFLSKSEAFQPTSKPTPSLSVVPVTGLQPANRVENFLPHQADDETVKTRVLTLFDQIEMHIDNYYCENPDINLTHTQVSEISKYTTPILPTHLDALLESTYGKPAVIKHCLGYYIVGLIAIPIGRDSIIPSEVTAGLSLAQGQGQRNLDDPNYMLAVSRWRTLTAYIRPELFDGTSLQDPNYESFLYELATDFSQAFAPFHNRRYDDEQRIKHLTEVFRTAAALALWLQSQPSTFQFEWGSNDSGKSYPTVVRVPAVLKSHDENGIALHPPLTIQRLIRKRL